MLVGIIAVGVMFLNMALAVWISKMEDGSARETARKVLIAVNLILIISALGYVFVEFQLNKY